MKTTINLSPWYEEAKVVETYLKEAPNKKEVHWFDLPNGTQFLLKNFPNTLRKLGKSNIVNIERLKKAFGKSKDINDLIVGIKKTMKGNGCLKVKFPIKLDNRDYVSLYSLMLSEGSNSSEFSLHVPEEFFHDLFHENIKTLTSDDFSKNIVIDFNNGFKRSRAPAKIRHLIPIDEHLPKFILLEKEFAREYLKIAFEAEGSPILNKDKIKRYIKLSRYVDISKYVNLELPSERRVYTGEIQEKYSSLYNKIKEYPPLTLLGEFILLKKHFDIDSKIILEAIKQNKTFFRTGKFSARWTLVIYANNINKFIQEINFISEKKREKCEEMLKIRANHPQYSTLKFIRAVENKGIILRKDFITIMKKEGYKSPSCYLHRFEKKGLLKRIEEGKYKLLID
ncbi:MAG: hypothetical protein Q7S55_05575 [Nanoarchaeota archaeon]|nr:hypothetical protein [Nanoarchaeota archaeon]